MIAYFQDGPWAGRFEDVGDIDPLDVPADDQPPSNVHGHSPPISRLARVTYRRHLYGVENPDRGTRLEWGEYAVGTPRPGL